MAAPLLYGEELTGLLYVDSTTLDAFSEDRLKLLQSFADQAAIAIENARALNEQLREANRQLRDTNRKWKP